jgi:hypothetical protein
MGRLGGITGLLGKLDSLGEEIAVPLHRLGLCWDWSAAAAATAASAANSLALAARSWP